MLFTQSEVCGQNVADTTIYLTPEKEPTFPGDSLMRFLMNNIKYPPIDKCETTGTIYVEFIIEKDGNISYANIKRGLHPIYDDEVLRIINSMPKWTPGYQNGLAVRTKRTIPIRIHLR